MRRVSGAGLRTKSAMTCDASSRIPHRHSRVGGKPQGRAYNKSKPTTSTVILASRQYPQGGM